MFTAVEETNELINVVIVEDYKLTRVGLRSTINEFEKSSFLINKTTLPYQLWY